MGKRDQSGICGKVNIIIAGGGIVGLNCALALSLKYSGYEIFVLEAEEFLGSHTSTRNSEVIHAGFAYPPGTLKSDLCIEGNRLSYELLNGLGVPVKRCGKWIVAFDETEEKGLESMIKNAAGSKVPGLVPKNPAEVNMMLPWLKTLRAAAFSGTSGILDASEYVSAMDRRLSNMPNCRILKKCRVTGIDTAGCSVETTRGSVQFDVLINSAGLFADEVYKMSGGKRNFEIRPFKGEYYTWPKGPIEGLIYPVPDRFLKKGDATLVSSMGIHLHRSISGDRYVGPSQVELKKDKKIDYKIDTPPSVFAEAAARYLKVPPAPGELQPAQAGNRPKLFEDGKAMGDFVILKEGPVIHLLGIESPGLTAAPAIARKVAQMI